MIIIIIIIIIIKNNTNNNRADIIHAPLIITTGKIYLY